MEYDTSRGARLMGGHRLALLAAVAAAVIGLGISGSSSGSSSSSGSGDTGDSGGVDPCATLVGVATMPEAQQKALLPWTAALGAAQPLVSDSSYPFCFLYGGQPSSTLLPRWEFSAATPRLLPDFSGMQPAAS
jgi:hypothetical protein